MNIFIDLTQQQYLDLWQHIIPPEADKESAAFIFAEVLRSEDSIVLKARDTYLVAPDEFAVQQNDYIELSDAVRIAIIKNAHITNTALIELHSHPFPGSWAAAFSYADTRGFEETVPHMWWRLPNRPYAAIVAAFDGFDALIWHEDPHKPENVTGLRVEGQILKPTNRTLGGFNVFG